jgi:hypothetical protein
MKRREGKKKVSEKSKNVNYNALAWTMLTRCKRMTGGQRAGNREQSMVTESRT